MITHTTLKAAAQTRLEDAQEEAGGYEQPTEVRNIALRDGSQSIDYTEDDVEEYASTMYPADEIEEDTCASQLDTLREGGDAHTDTFTGFLEWLKSEERLVIRLSDTELKAKMRERAEKAAREYEMNTRNDYFSTRPEELHEVLVNIILGAHELLKEIEAEADH